MVCPAFCRLQNWQKNSRHLRFCLCRLWHYHIPALLQTRLPVLAASFPFHIFSQFSITVPPFLRGHKEAYLFLLICSAKQYRCFFVITGTLCYKALRPWMD